MKRFIKICLISVLVLAILGSILLGAGIAVGGKNVASDSADIIFKPSSHHFAVQFSDSLNRCFRWFDKDNDSDDDLFDDNFLEDLDSDKGHHHGSEINDNEVFEIPYTSLDSLSLNIKAATITFKTDKELEKPTVKISYHSGSHKLLISDEGDGEIDIYSNSQKNIGLGNAPKVLISLPENYAIDELDIDLGAGELFFNDAIKAAECEIEVGSGNLQAEALFANELEINIAAGNVNITLDGAKDDFNYNLSCALGNIVLGKTESDSGFDNNCVIKNNAKNDVAINCAAGNIEVYFTK